MTKSDPTEIGRYIVEAKIGQGAMGDVYLAVDYRIYRNVAIKILRLDRLSNEKERSTARKLFFQEARITGKLNHPNITTIYDMGIHTKKPFLVEEYVKGSDLKRIMTKEEDFSFKEKVSIISVIVRAFHYAHQRGVLHRDIKPANIMLLENGVPKIMDFGIAGLMDKSSGKSKRNSIDKDVVVFGTPQYMSPEHIGGKKYDRRSEIFSLGTLAFEWLSGHKPFSGTTIKDLLHNIIKSDHKSLFEIMEIDKKFSEIIDKALSRNQRDRYQNAEEFADAIELYLNNLEMENEQVLPANFSFDKGKIIEKLRKKYLFFSDFSKDELVTIFKLSQKIKYIAGEYIIREGTPGTKMYIILSGTVSIQNEVDGQEIVIEKLGPGSCVGEMALVDKMARSASVVASESTLAIAINETVLRLSNPEICLKLYRNMATMLSEKLRANDIKYRELLATSK